MRPRKRTWPDGWPARPRVHLHHFGRRHAHLKRVRLLRGDAWMREMEQILIDNVFRPSYLHVILSSQCIDAERNYADKMREWQERQEQDRRRLYGKMVSDFLQGKSGFLEGLVR